MSENEEHRYRLEFDVVTTTRYRTHVVAGSHAEAVKIANVEYQRNGTKRARRLKAEVSGSLANLSVEDIDHEPRTTDELIYGLPGD